MALFRGEGRRQGDLVSGRDLSRVCCLANTQAPECAESLGRLEDRLREGGYEIVDEPGTVEDGAQVLLVLGGDGFLMECLHRYDFPQQPIFGVNFGTVGFHMNPQSCLDDVVEILTSGNYQADEHPVLRVNAELEDGRQEELFAFNDVLLERQTRQSVRFSVFLDGVLFNKFAGDGFVVATAAGSTAYNLAAGGPAVHPELAAMVVTPLYPHQAVPFSSVRFSLAVPLDRSLVFVAEDLPKRGMRLVADGRPLDGASRVEVLDSTRRITLLRAENMGFAEVLSRKIIGG